MSSRISSPRTHPPGETISEASAVRCPQPLWRTERGVKTRRRRRKHTKEKGTHQPMSRKLIPGCGSRACRQMAYMWGAEMLKPQRCTGSGLSSYASACWLCGTKSPLGILIIAAITRGDVSVLLVLRPFTSWETRERRERVEFCGNGVSSQKKKKKRD